MGNGDSTLLLALIARMGGFFLLSPFFSQKGISIPIRIGLSIVISLLLFPTTLHQIQLPALSWSAVPTLLSEVAIGYFMGLMMALVIESGMLAGQVIGALFGFSATEFFDPIASSPQPLMGRLFALLFFSLFLTLDLHHLLLGMLYTSFVNAPPFNPVSSETMRALTAGVDLFFSTALNYIFIPFIFFLPLVLIFAVAVRLFPQGGLMWLLFPLQALLGLSVVLSLIPIFAPLLQQACYKIFSLISPLLFPL